MKLLVLIISLAFGGTLLAANSVREEKKTETPRLNDVAAFPEKDRAAVRAIIALVVAEGGKPSEYFAELTPAKDGQIDVYLKHETHPADDSGWRGDACSHCRITRYDPKTGKVAPLRGIR